MVPGLVTIKTRTKPATKAGKRPGQLVQFSVFQKGLICCHSPHGACNMKPVAALMRGLSFQAHVRQGGDGQGAASQDCGEGVRGQGCQRSVLMRRWHLEEPVMPQGCALLGQGFMVLGVRARGRAYFRGHSWSGPSFHLPRLVCTAVFLRSLRLRWHNPGVRKNGLLYDSSHASVPTLFD